MPKWQQAPAVPKWAMAPIADEVPRGPTLAGRTTELRQGKPPHWWQPEWLKEQRERFFGSPEQAAAEEAGILTQPPTGRVLGAIAEAATFLGAGPAALAGTRGVAGRIGAWAMAHPKTSIAAVEATPSLLKGDVEGAARHAAYGAAGGAVFQGGMAVARNQIERAAEKRLASAAAKAPKTIWQAIKEELGYGLTPRTSLVPAAAATTVPEAAAAIVPVEALTSEQAAAKVSELMAAGRHDEARAVVEKLRAITEKARMAAGVAPKTPVLPVPGNVKPATIFTRPGGPIPPGKISPRSADLIEGQRAILEGADLGNPLLGSDVQDALRAGRSAAAVDAGKAVATAHNKLMAFAKNIAKENPKAGEKIWMLLDETGAPTKWLTPFEAGAAARAGKATTWVKNLWETGSRGGL